jgi:hypothetical protein
MRPPANLCLILFYYLLRFTYKLFQPLHPLLSLLINPPHSLFCALGNQNRMLAGSHFSEPVNHLSVLSIYILAYPVSFLIQLPLKALDSDEFLLDFIHFGSQSIP